MKNTFVRKNLYTFLSGIISGLIILLIILFITGKIPILLGAGVGTGAPHINARYHDGYETSLSAGVNKIYVSDSNNYLPASTVASSTIVDGTITGSDLSSAIAITTSGTTTFSGTVYMDSFNRNSCPSGMIPVSPSPADGMSGFCVDKYEAKNVGGIATSQTASTPWVSIAQYTARAECIRAGKHLITEKEWQAIAHNIEGVGWNWQGGVAGTNNMSDGHSDNSPANSLAASTDSDPCSGTEQSCDVDTWSSQRRTYKLSNSEYIWDFGGNVWEWVDQMNYADYPVYNSTTSGWQICSTSGDGICGNTKTTNDQWYRGGSSDLRGFIRGGNWYSGAHSGAFTLILVNAPAITSTNIGFRCAR